MLHSILLQYTGLSSPPIAPPHSPVTSPSRVPKPIIALQSLSPSPAAPPQPPNTHTHTPAPALSHPCTDGWLGSVVQLWSSSLRAPRKPPPHRSLSPSSKPTPSSYMPLHPPPNQPNSQPLLLLPTSLSSLSDENNVRNPKQGTQLRKLITLSSAAHLPQHSLLTLSFLSGPSNKTPLTGAT